MVLPDHLHALLSLAGSWADSLSEELLALEGEPLLIPGGSIKCRQQPADVPPIRVDQGITQPLETEGEETEAGMLRGPGGTGRDTCASACSTPRHKVIRVAQAMASSSTR